MKDKFIKFLLVFAALYFLVHIGVALAQQVPISPTVPIMQCWSNGMGTIQCIQL